MLIVNLFGIGAHKEIGYEVKIGAKKHLEKYCFLYIKTNVFKLLLCFLKYSIRC
jgi:hypothetical protein